MSSERTQRDTRSIVTPDAFEVAEDLLGMPLATPGSRAGAMIIDLAVIGLITAVTQSFALVLGVVAAGFFMRAGFKRTPVRGSVFGRAMRFSVGCLGMFIAMITAVVWTSCGVDLGSGARTVLDDRPIQEEGALGQLGGALRSAVVLTAELDAFADAESVEEAEVAARELIEAGEALGVPGEQMRMLLEEGVPDDAPWRSEAGALITRLLDGGTRVVEEPVSTEVAQGIAAMTDAEALEAYRSALASGPGDPESVARVAALEGRLSQVVAGDTIGALIDRVERLERVNETQRGELERSEEALRDAESGGVFGVLRDFVDELGFGFGWASLYLTIFLSWWKGQTIGKKLVGIRVMRLDGEPITWWVAFERAGGYAAGFATGLLGFAQVYWDANRQAIHDRIVGTVVVVDRADKITDWESAL